MAKEIPYLYTSYEFTEQEYPLAVCFTELQRKYLQSELALLAAERIEMAFDPQNPYETFGKLEHLRGKIEQLKALLITDEQTQAELRALLRDQVTNTTQTD